MKKFNTSADITIGVVIPSFWAAHYFKCLWGIRNAALKYNVNLLCFQGFYCSDTYSSEYALSYDCAGEIIFDLIQKDILNGLIIQSGTLKTLDLKSKLVDLCKKRYSLPIVNVGSKIEGVTNILVDNETGMRDILNHLIHKHGYKRLGFLRGPEDNLDSKIRFKTFTDVLTENNIQVDSNKISSAGSWSINWGMAGTRELLKKNNNQLDVIVCASDMLANGSYQELQNQGITIPDQIAVVGFNDNLYGQSCTPSLSSVNINLYERNWKAVEIMISQIKGTPLPKEIFVPSTLVIRQSCGCPPIGIRAVETFKSSTPLAPLDATNGLSLIKDHLTAEVQQALKQSPTSYSLVKAEEFVDSFLTQMNDFTKKTFLPQFGEILHHFARQKSDITQWHWALNVLAQRLDNIVSETHRSKAAQCITQARILIGEIAEQEHRVFLMQVEERNAAINSLNYTFNKVNTFEKIIELLTEELPRIGIHSCYLSLYEDREKPLQKARLILAFNEKGRIDIPPEGILFPSQQLLPDYILEMEQKSILIIEPLFYGDQQLGFTMFELDSLERSFYELFPSQLSAALWGSILFSKEQLAEVALKDQTIQLEQSNIELTKWNAQLEMTYQQLQGNQEKLLVAEKMASLGRLTAGITHEMNTPLATLRASLSELQKLASEYMHSISDPSIGPEDHKEIATEIFNSMNLADKAAERAATFIRSIKAQTRDVKTTEGQSFNLIDIIEGVIVFLGHSLKQSKCTVKLIDSQEKIELFGSPTKMTQVFTNLITNAIDALVPAGGGAIKIDLEKTAPDVLIVKVEDNGCGISQENLSKVFEPMFSTKSFGQGTGLGLSIVHDIVCGEFGGSIKVESQLGSSTVFTMQFNLM